MNITEKNRLSYRRQYLLAPEDVECPFQHIRKELFHGYRLYTHKDLPLSHYTLAEKEFFLMGDIYDYKSDHKSNLEILKLICRAGSSQELLSSLEPYTGSYALLYMIGEEIYLVSDPYASRKIYHSRPGGKSWCSSHPHLLAKVLDYSISEDTSKQAYFKSQRFEELNRSGIASTTCYDEIEQVLPNHVLSLSSGRTDRFWPREERKPMSVQEVAEQCAPIIRGYVENIAARFEVMLPITAGKDSRTLLAASREISDRVYFYINKVKGSNTNIPDFTLPPELTRHLGLEYHIVDTDIEVDPDFREVFLENNPHALEHYLPMIYSYYRDFGDRVNLPGSVATGGQWWYPIYRKNKTVDTLLDIYQLKDFPHAREAYREWLKGSREAADGSGFELFDLFYWEERLGNWGSQIQLDKDMAQLDINPMNSRLLVKIMLSVDPYYTLEFGTYKVNREINMLLWPETMDLPINPSQKNNFLILLEKAGLLGHLYRMKFR